jgi:uncharacterized membrane protein
MDLEGALDKPPLAAQLVSLILPVVLAIAILLTIKMLWGAPKARELVYLSLASFFALGKFVIFAPLVHNVNFTIPLLQQNINLVITYSAWEMGAMIVYMDTMVALIVIYNLHLLNKVPWIGPKLRDIRKDCYYLLKATPWMRKSASVAIVLFVFFPVAGTGAVSGGFLSNLLGFGRLYSVFLIFLGALLSAFVFGWSAVYTQDNLQKLLERPVISWTMLALVILAIVGSSWKLKRMIAKQKAIEGKAKPQK